MTVVKHPTGPVPSVSGQSGKYLTTDGSELSWGTLSTADNYTLLNTGGTSLTGATDITINGISGKNSLIIYVYNASSVNANSEIKLRVNSGGDSYFNSLYMTDAATNTIDVDETHGGYWLETQTKMGQSATDRVKIILCINGCATTGAKPYNWSSFTNISTGGQASTGSGFSLIAGAITSVTINSSTGNFDAGTIWVYGA